MNVDDTFSSEYFFFFFYGFNFFNEFTKISTFVLFPGTAEI